MLGPASEAERKLTATRSIRGNLYSNDEAPNDRALQLGEDTGGRAIP
jgi:hypothetical protein